MKSVGSKKPETLTLLTLKRGFLGRIYQVLQSSMSYWL